MNNQMKRGKKPQRKYILAEGWWDRLVNFCQAKNLAKNNEEIYTSTRVSRRTFANAKKSNQFTELVFDTLVQNLKCKNRDELLGILAAPNSSDAPKVSKPSWSPPPKSPNVNVKVAVPKNVAVDLAEKLKFKETQAELQISGEIMGAEFADQHPEYDGLIEKFKRAFDDYQYAYMHKELGEDDESIVDSFSGLIDFISRDEGNKEPFVQLQSTFEHYKDWDWWSGFKNGLRDKYRERRDDERLRNGPKI
jgi:hypothetical protein